jgi:hypothetical protein
LADVLAWVRFLIWASTMPTGDHSAQPWVDGLYSE